MNFTPYDSGNFISCLIYFSYYHIVLCLLIGVHVNLQDCLLLNHHVFLFFFCKICLKKFWKYSFTDVTKTVKIL